MERQTDYTENANELLRIAKADFDDNNWTPYKNKGDIKSWYKYYPKVCNLARYKIEATINKPIQTVLGYVWDATFDSMNKEDPSLIDFEILETGENYKVRRFLHQLSWPVWNRETVFTQVKHQEGNDVYLIGYSVDHNKAPLKTHENVRTTVHLSVYKYTRVDQNTTRVQRVAQIDPNGDIPHWMVEAKAGKALDTFAKWQE